MANTFKSSLTSSIPLVLTTIYTAPIAAGAIATIIGLGISNKVTTAATVDVTILRPGQPATAYYLIRNGVIPVGGTLTIAGADQKIVLMANDVIQALASIPNSLDAVISVLEITV